MADPDAGHIPEGVREGMACSVDFWLQAGSDEKRVFGRALRSYECALCCTSGGEWRVHLSELYLACGRPADASSRRSSAARSKAARLAQRTMRRRRSSCRGRDRRSSRDASLHRLSPD